MKAIIKMIVVVVTMMAATNVYASDMCETNANSTWTKGHTRVMHTKDGYEIQVMRQVHQYQHVITIETMPFEEIAHQICTATARMTGE